METPGSSHQDELVSKKGNNVTSVIWKWFGFERSDVKQTLVKCKICRKSVATGSGSTTNLFQHLRQRHQAEWLQCTKLRDENNTVIHPKTTDPPRNAQRQPAPEDPQPAPVDPQPAPEVPQPAPEDPQPAPEDPQPAPEDPQPAPEDAAEDPAEDRPGLSNHEQKAPERTVFYLFVCCDIFLASKNHFYCLFFSLCFDLLKRQTEEKKKKGVRARFKKGWKAMKHSCARNNKVVLLPTQSDLDPSDPQPAPVDPQPAPEDPQPAPEDPQPAPEDPQPAPEDAAEDPAEDRPVEKKRVEKKRVEKKRAEKKRAEKKRAEKKRAEKKRAEKKRAEKKRAEKKRAEKKRAEKKRAEKKRAEKKRAEKKRAEKKRAEKKRAEKKRAEKKRIPRLSAHVCNVNTCTEIIQNNNNDCQIKKCEVDD
ncbi:hypothetical protein E1301_Tti021733 [Triplophysa tibetana]|uniref:BED-type domain-containing protein n=1 Tax=Triplophysa tibetana TaxID=1572043 RepID=A0A5A9PI83_9TELE|nr:hypothetical protein E1301_Tti021733 [Triplophysa tibetana]